MSKPVEVGDIVMSELNYPDDGECVNATWMVVKDSHNFDNLTCIRLATDCDDPKCQDWGLTWVYEPEEDDAQTISRLTQTNGEWIWEVIHE